MIKAIDVKIGMTIIVPKFRSTRNGITIKNIKPGRFKSQLRFCYDTTSVDVFINEPIEVINDSSS